MADVREIHQDTPEARQFEVPVPDASLADYAPSDEVDDRTQPATGGYELPASDEVGTNMPLPTVAMARGRRDTAKEGSDRTSAESDAPPPAAGSSNIPPIDPPAKHTPMPFPDPDGERHNPGYDAVPESVTASEAAHAAGDLAVEAAMVPTEATPQVFGSNEIRQAVYSYAAKAGQAGVRLSLPPDQVKLFRLMQNVDLTLEDVAAQMGSTEAMLDNAHRVIGAFREHLTDEQQEYVPRPAAQEIDAIRRHQGTTYAQLREGTGMSGMLLEHFLRGDVFLSPERVKNIVDHIGAPAGEAEMVMAQYQLDWARWRAESADIPPAAHREVEAIRIEGDVTRRALATQAGIPASDLTKFFNGEAVLAPEKLQSLLGALQINPDRAEAIMTLYVSDRQAWEAAQLAPEEADPNKLVLGQGQGRRALQFLHHRLGESGHELAGLREDQQSALSTLLDPNISDDRARELLGAGDPGTASRRTRELIDMIGERVGFEGMEHFRVSVTTAERTNAASRIDAIRQQRGISTEALAEQLGMPPLVLRNIFSRDSYGSEVLLLRQIMGHLEVPEAEASAIAEAYEAEKFAALGRYSNTGVIAELSVTRQIRQVTRQELADAADINIPAVDRFFDGKLVHPDIFAAFVNRLGITGARARTFVAGYASEVEAVRRAAQARHSTGDALRAFMPMAKSGTGVKGGVVSIRPVICEAVGISLASLEKILAGTVYAPPERIAAILELLEVPPARSAEILEGYVAQKTRRDEAMLRYRGVTAQPKHSPRR